MKAIINGKRYDTEKATKIGAASSNVGISDFGWWGEDLYKTPRSGAYFLACKGNGSSRYAEKWAGGGWGPGEKVTPLTKAEAMAWAEENRLTEALEAHFADMIEDA